MTLKCLATSSLLRSTTVATGTMRTTAGKSMMTIQIKIDNWSATDYSYLVNNELGWVSDNQKYYEFDNLENKSKMERYLRGGGREMKLAWLCYLYDEEDDILGPEIRFVEPERWRYRKVVPIVYSILEGTEK